MAEPFTLDDYRSIIRGGLDLGYEFATFDSPHTGPLAEGVIYLRHDVDRTPEGAALLARLAAEEGVRGTFFFLLRTESYNVATRRCVDIIRQISGAGHAVGLHFNHLEHPTPSDESERVRQIQKEARLLADVTGAGISCFSMHNPDDSLRIDVPGFINAYAPRFFDDALYISDSNRKWKPVHPLEGLSPKHAGVVQILIHPEWHGSNFDSERQALIHHVVSVAGRVMDEDNAQNRALQERPLSFSEIADSLSRLDP